MTAAAHLVYCHTVAGRGDVRHVPRDGDRGAEDPVDRGLLRPGDVPAGARGEARKTGGVPRRPGPAWRARRLPGRRLAEKVEGVGWRQEFSVSSLL